ncbi:hypothetical protein K32_12980 [Kaistia sp. 32K]|uniref:helix-turn-helix domain-containing protein n=1 Tax=Kaistia sp. 32K TaxID=2795690 RepID=UPI0019156A3D|nr:AraC family transcriptional regulator [Kaistia sp. 32K]BCP52681.1 hypothetical protein K32_12980 [Kaistia sp. 32K]
MTLDAIVHVVDKAVGLASVPVGLPASSNHRLAFRGISRSRLISADIRYGPTPAHSAAATRPSSRCNWTDACSIGVRLQDETSDVFETHRPYLSGVEPIDFNAPRHAVEIILPQSFLREIAEDLEVPYVTHLGNSLYPIVDDPFLMQLVLRIHPFFEAPETLDPRLADHLMWELGIYVCARYGDLATRRRVVGGLSTWQERLAKEIIETSLIGGIGLAELAAPCGLRTSQFAHAFKRSTGVAPHQWLLGRRMARATEMIAARQVSLADVAGMCGFADQAHMTRMFSRHLGKTPATYRSAPH